MSRAAADEQIRYVTREQVDTLLRVCSVSIRDHAMFTVGYWRGLRASEYGLLPLEAYKQESGRLYVTRVKGSVSAEYRLCKGELTALRAWLKIRGLEPGPLFISRRGDAISRQQIHKLFSHYANHAGWPPNVSHSHTLRHSIAVHLLQKGVDIYAVKDWLGHTTISSTEVYARVTTPVRERAAAVAYEEDQEGTTMVKVVKAKWNRDRRRAKPVPVPGPGLEPGPGSSVVVLGSVQTGAADG